MKLSEIKTLFLGLTNRCNAKCITCWHSNNQVVEPIDLSSKIYYEIQKKLFPHIKVLDVCGGGEVFLSPLFNILMSDIRNYKFKTIITSNFSVINLQHIINLVHSNVDFVVSLDGSTSELQEFLRPGCEFNKIIDNIKYFISHGHKVTIQTTVSEDNFYDIDNMLQLAERLRVDNVRFHPVRLLENINKPYKFKSCPVDVKYLTKILNKKYNMKYSICFDYYHRGIKKTYIEIVAYYFKEFFKNKKNKVFCSKMRDSIKIQEDGRVLSCCLPNSKIVGDLNLNTLEDVISSFDFNNVRRTCVCDMMN